MFNLITRNVSYDSFIYKSNINNLIWDIPTVSGAAPQIREEIKAVSDNSGKIHIFGGNNYSLDTTSATWTIFSDMVDFDIVSSTWSDSSTTVNGRTAYTATLLPNGTIVYVGGYEVSNLKNSLTMSDISQIYLYDTNSLEWSTMVCVK